MTKINNIILARPDRIGDVIISTSCLKVIKEKYPKAKIYFLASSNLKLLFHNHPDLDEFVSIPKGKIEILVPILKNLKADIVIHLQPNLKIEEAAAQAKILIRIGFSFKKNNHKWLTHWVKYEKHKGKKHEAQYLFELLKYIGIKEPKNIKTKISPKPLEKLSLIHFALKNIINKFYAIIHVGAYNNKPKISFEYLKAITLYLGKKYKLHIIFVGTSVLDFHIANKLQYIVKDKVKTYNFCQKTNLTELAWLLKNAKIAISRDSGPAHLSAAMGTVTVTYFITPNAINSSYRWQPLGKYSHIIEYPMKKFWWENDHTFAKRNLRKVSIFMIYSVIDKALKKLIII